MIDILYPEIYVLINNYIIKIYYIKNHIRQDK